MGYFADIVGTLRNTFRVNKATLDASALNAPRTFALPDLGGTFALVGGTAVALTPVTLDFGSAPVFGATFSFAVAAATTASRVLLSAAPDSDEYEMDAFVCAAWCAVNGTIIAYVQPLPGPVSGAYKFSYLLG